MVFSKAYRAAQYPDYVQENGYVQYKRLKGILHSIKAVDDPTTPDALHDALADEITRVARVVRARLGAITRAAEEQLAAANEALNEGQALDCTDVAAVADALTIDVLRLQEVRNLNADVIARIMRRYCRFSILPPAKKVQDVASDPEFNYPLVDRVLYNLSGLYAHARGDAVAANKQQKENETQQDFVRRSVKYWVHKQDMPFVLARVLRHLPLHTMCDTYTSSKKQLKAIEREEKRTAKAINVVKSADASPPPHPQVDVPFPATATGAAGPPSKPESSSDVAGSVQPATPGTPEDGRWKAAPAHPKDPYTLGSPIGSVYYENPRFLFYHRRLERLEGSSLLRTRWYGSPETTPEKFEVPDVDSDASDDDDDDVALENTAQAKPPAAVNDEGNPLKSGTEGAGAGGESQDALKMKLQRSMTMLDKFFDDKEAEAANPALKDETQVFMELKVHHEAWSGEQSTKRRFPLPNRDVDLFMSGKLSMNDAVAKLKAKKASAKDIEKFKSLATEVLAMVSAYGLRPALRTAYTRAAFQRGNDQSVRVSVDTDMYMSSEDFGIGKHWRYEGKESMASTKFPFAVVEVKLQCAENDRIAPWIEELMQCRFMEAVPKFSKYSHGIATLFGRSDRISLLPYWHQQVTPSLDIRAATKVDGVAVDARQGLVHGGLERTLDSAIFSSNPPQTRTTGGALHQALPSVTPECLLLAAQLTHRTAAELSPVTAAGAAHFPPTPTHSQPTTGYIGMTEQLAQTAAAVPLHIRQQIYVEKGVWPDADGRAATEEVCCGEVKDGAEGRFGQVPWQTAKRVKVPQKYDPKTLLAAERQFVKWVQNAAQLGVAGVAVLHFGAGGVDVPFGRVHGSGYQPGQSAATGIGAWASWLLALRAPVVIGLLMVIVAIVTMFYALSVFHARSRRVYAKVFKLRFDDVMGPTLLTIFLMAGLIITGGIQIVARYGASD